VSSLLAERVRAQLDGLSVSGLDVPTFSRSALEALRRAVPFSGACFATSDPATGIVTGTVKAELDDHHDDEWAHFEYVVPDTSAFLEIVRRPGRVVGLRTETDGRTELSPRFTEFIQRYWDFGDEMRAALTVDGRTWGFIALFREGPGAGFTPLEQAFMSSVGGALATGLRGGLLAAAAAAGPHVDGPAVLVVDGHGEIASASLGAAARVADLGGGPLGEAPLPLALLSLGRLVPIWSGFCGLALVMTGHQSLMLWLSVAVGVVTVAGELLAVRAGGITAVALAAAAGATLLNLAAWVAARLTTGMWTHLSLRSTVDAAVQLRAGLGRLGRRRSREAFGR
jgi:hypothetical protein